MKIQHINGTWLTEEAVEGEAILITSGSKAKGGEYAGHTTIYKINNPSDTLKTKELEWQDNQLKKYDNKLQTDRPNAARILEYRQELRDYILHVDFPNGTRPEL